MVALQVSRRVWLAGAAGVALSGAVAALFTATPARAEAELVPARLQAKLLSKVAGYDRNFKRRAGERALVLVVVRGGDAESERTGEQLESELRSLEKVGGLPHEESVVAFESAEALASLVRQRGAAIVYLAPGLGDEVGAIADALAGTSVLSVGALASFVERRAVVGFERQGGKAKIVVHLKQARRQKVKFRSSLLKLARVIQ